MTSRRLNPRFRNRSGFRVGSGVRIDIGIRGFGHTYPDFRVRNRREPEGGMWRFRSVFSGACQIGLKGVVGQVNVSCSTNWLRHKKALRLKLCEFGERQSPDPSNFAKASKREPRAVGSMGRVLNHDSRGARKSRKSATRLAILAMLFVVAVAPPLFGQSDDYQPFGELFAGYSFASQGSATLHGWHASLESRLTERVGILMDFSGHYVSGPAVFDLLDDSNFDFPDDADFGLYTYRFGPQVRIFNAGAVTTFAHVLVGGNYVWAHGVDDSVGTNGFAAAAGGGADWNIGENLALRIPQFDYSLVRIGGGTLYGFRVSTGMVFRFR